MSNKLVGHNSENCPVCGNNLNLHTAPSPVCMLLIKEDKRFVKVMPDDIELIEGMKDYIKVFTKNKLIITHMTMAKIEKLLDKSDFMRVNRSYIIRKSAIQNIGFTTIELTNKMQIPVGINYRDMIKKVIERGML